MPESILTSSCSFLAVPSLVLPGRLRAISALGCLAQFPGMLTDSRSVLSVPRHEYFRRILCRLLGRDMQGGLLPDDLPAVGAMVRAIAFGNANALFA